MHPCIYLCVQYLCAILSQRLFYITPPQPVVLLIFTRACIRGKVISHVVIVMDTKLPNLEIQAPGQVVSTTNMLNLVKSWLQYMLRIEWHGLQVSQIEYLSWPQKPHSSTVPTMHYACAFCSCAQLTSYVQVKVVDSIIMPMLHDNTVQMQGVCGVCALRVLVQNFDCILHFEVICQIVCYSNNNTITSNSVVFFLQ